MKEKPILFSGPMVKAILDGRKTQTRRVVKPQPPDHAIEVFDWQHHNLGEAGCYYDDMDGLHFHCKRQYGNVGDRLWVRETARATATEEGIDCIHYSADDYCRSIMVSEYGPWQKMRSYGGGHARVVPSIHMPRWASRITLEITGVRVELLSDISEEDAIAEGFKAGDGSPVNGFDTEAKFPAVASFESLWSEINGPGSWSLNPWVWVISFERVMTEVRS